MSVEHEFNVSPGCRTTQSLQTTMPFTDNRTTGATSRAHCTAPVKSSPPTNQHPALLQAGCPFCHPTNSVKALKEKISHSMDLLTPSSPGALPTLSLTTNSSWLPWGRVAMPLISPLMPVPQFIDNTL